MKIANRISAVKMNGDKSKRTHLRSEESSRGATKATGYLKRQKAWTEKASKRAGQEENANT